MRAFVVTVSEAECELATDVLWGIGVVAIEEREDADGRTELWTHVGDGDDAIAQARQEIADRWESRIVEVDEEAAASTWREFVEPIRVSDELVVLPSWLDDAELTPNVSGQALVARIDPGPSFGMGDHPTTQSTLRAMLSLWSALGPTPRVLDVGCGSGVLGIVAALKGASDVVAVDHSAAAVDATRVNAVANGVDSQIAASGRRLDELDEPNGAFDLVLANILAPALIELAADLQRLTAPTGRLIISGILADRHDHVLAALSPMRVLDTLTLDGWAAVVLTH